VEDACLQDGADFVVDVGAVKNKTPRSLRSFSKARFDANEAPGTIGPVTFRDSPPWFSQLNANRRALGATSRICSTDCWLLYRRDLHRPKPSPIIRAWKRAGPFGLPFGNFVCTALTPIDGRDPARPVDRKPQNYQLFRLAPLTVRCCVGAPYPEDGSNRPAFVDAPLKLVAENATGAAPSDGLCHLWRAAWHRDRNRRKISFVGELRDITSGARAAPRIELGARAIRARGTIGRRKNVLIGLG
jgi:hypothetical protein